MMNNSGSSNKVKFKFFAKPIYTLDKNTITSTEFCASFGTSPALAWWLGYGIQAADYTGTTGSAIAATIIIKITFYIIAYDLLTFTK